MPRSLLGLPRVYWVLWIGQFVNRLGGFVLTFLPLYLTERLHFSPSRAGALLSLYGLGGLVGASVGGWASDRFGRRRTILAALLASAPVLLCFGAARTLPFIVAAAFAHGVTNAYGPALNAAVTDVVDPSDRVRAYGYFYWAVNLGFTLAAFAGGALSRRGYHWLFIGDAATTLVFAALVFAFVPETLASATDGRERPGLASSLRVFADPRFVGFAAAQFMVILVFLQAFVTLPMQERARGLPVSEVGLIAGLNGAVIVAVQPLFLRLTRTQSGWRLLTLAATLIGVGALVAAEARTLSAFALCMVLVSLGEVSFSGAAPNFVAQVAPSHLRGTYQGAHSVCWAAASLLGPLVGPWARERFGSAVMWHAGAGLCALAAVLHALTTRRSEVTGDASRGSE